MSLSIFQKNTQLETIELKKVQDYYKRIKKMALIEDEDYQEADEVALVTLEFLNLTDQKTFNALKKYKFNFNTPCKSFLYMMTHGFFDDYLQKHPDIHNFLHSKKSKAPIFLLSDKAGETKEINYNLLDAIEHVYTIKPDLIKPQGNDTYLWKIFSKVPGFNSMVEELELKSHCENHKNNSIGIL